MFNPLKYFRNNKVGLALGSGGAKGLSHIAIINYLESQQIPIDMIAGSSIGAVVGAIYCVEKTLAKNNMQMFAEDTLKLSKRELYRLFDPVFPKSGLVEGKGFLKWLKKYIPEHMNIEDLKIPLTIVATDFVTGQSVLFKKGNILEALRASISIPGVFVPVFFKDSEHVLIDGGVSNPLPINIVKKMGAGISIAVNLHPRVSKKRWKKYVKYKMRDTGLVIESQDLVTVKQSTDISVLDKTKKNREWEQSVEKWLDLQHQQNKQSKKAKRNLPHIFEVISRSFDIMEYVNTRLMLKYNKPSVLFEPEVMKFSTFDFNKTREIIAAGEEECKRLRNVIRAKVKIWL